MGLKRGRVGVRHVPFWQRTFRIQGCVVCLAFHGHACVFTVYKRVGVFRLITNTRGVRVCAPAALQFFPVHTHTCVLCVFHSELLSPGKRASDWQPQGSNENSLMLIVP